MHYFQFNIGDYKSHTDYLTLIEDLAYRRMLDWCYLHEKPLPVDPDEVARKIGMREYADSVELILTDFFEKTEGGFTQNRIIEEITAFKAKSEIARNNGKRGGRPRKETQNKPAGFLKEPNPNPEETGLKAKHKPRTINHKPRTNNQLKEKTCQPSADVDAVFSHWIDVMGKSKTVMLTPKRKKAIAGRLKDGYPVVEILEAINNCGNSAFHMGQNDRQQVYDDIELICRTGEKLEQFRDMPINDGMSKSARSTKQAGLDWLNEGNSNG